MQGRTPDHIAATTFQRTQTQLSASTQASFVCGDENMTQQQLLQSRQRITLAHSTSGGGQDQKQRGHA